ncbi:MAG: C40 family peptidase, partial [Clostridia bacterium]|nr:C40 family peptidase [Clostridia bacterium]
MKKSLALLLALFMILSVFAACGEKQQPAVTDGSDTAAAIDGQSTTPPESTDEPEDGEKEATEITPPDMPAIITTDPVPQGQSGNAQQQTPQTGTPQTQTPQTQIQEPQTGTQQQTQTPSSTQPAQTTTPAPVADKTEYTAYFFGDSFIVNNALADNIIAFARYDGIKLTIRNNDYDNNGTISTYNFYERFNYSGDTATGVKDNVYLLQSVLSKQNEYDFFLLLTGRDRTVSMTSNGNKTFSAYELAQKQYLAANPNGRIILLVPSGYEEGNDGKLAEKIGLKVSSLKEHNDLIKQYAARLASVSPADKTLMSQMGDAFDFFRTNYGSSGIELYDHSHIYPSNAASYYMACILYAQMFGKSAYGMKEYGFLDEETATLMQKAAHRFVFGKEPSGTHAADKYVPSFDEINPKTSSKRDPRFANEKYPQYYDELIATMYSIFARERWAQYDQMGIDKVKFTSIRRSIYTLPESINPQNTVYLDCSGFTFSTFMNAFGYNFDDPNMRTEYLINYDKGRIMSWNGMNPDIPAEEAKEKLWGLLEPGDVIVHRDETNESTSKWYGHVMIYAGNGMIMHCSGSSHSGGGSADYNFDANLDGKEYLGGIIYEPVDYLFDKDGKQAMFNGNRRINILRPPSLGLKPTEQAVLRAKNLAGIIAYKETSAPRGVTVNPGEDVTFTYVFRNDTNASKTVEIVDFLPVGVTYKS